jgi:hypothetical protein
MKSYFVNYYNNVEYFELEKPSFVEGLDGNDYSPNYRVVSLTDDEKEHYDRVVREYNELMSNIRDRMDLGSISSVS